MTRLAQGKAVLAEKRHYGIQGPRCRVYIVLVCGGRSYFGQYALKLFHFGRYRRHYGFPCGVLFIADVFYGFIFQGFEFVIRRYAALGYPLAHLHIAVELGFPLQAFR